MKKLLMGLIAGILIGVIVATSTVFAVNMTTLYDVVADGVRIVVDGQKLIPTDAKGNEVQPIIYNGTTYLPVRAIANAFGKAVYWDGPSYTVYLGEMNGKLEYPTVKLEDMTSISDKYSAVKSEHLTDNYGNRYSTATCFQYYDGTLEYLTNMKYSRFKGTLYVCEGEHEDYTKYLTIEADGKTLYTSPEMSKTSRPVDIDVNVRGYNDVKIVFHGRNHFWILLADAGFYQ